MVSDSVDGPTWSVGVSGERERVDSPVVTLVFSQNAHQQGRQWIIQE